MVSNLTEANRAAEEAQQAIVKPSQVEPAPAEQAAADSAAAAEPEDTVGEPDGYPTTLSGPANEAEPVVMTPVKKKRPTIKSVREEMQAEMEALKKTLKEQNDVLLAEIKAAKENPDTTLESFDALNKRFDELQRTSKEAEEKYNQVLEKLETITAGVNNLNAMKAQQSQAGNGNNAAQFSDEHLFILKKMMGDSSMDSRPRWTDPSGVDLDSYLHRGVRGVDFYHQASDPANRFKYLAMTVLPGGKIHVNPSNDPAVRAERQRKALLAIVHFHPDGKFSYTGTSDAERDEFHKLAAEMAARGEFRDLNGKVLDKIIFDNKEYVQPVQRPSAAPPAGRLGGAASQSATGSAAVALQPVLRTLGQRFGF